jgi:hypothetical protein
LLPDRVLTQVWLTWEKAWLGPHDAGPAAVVVLPVVLVGEVVAVLVVLVVVVGVVVGAVVWVGAACVWVTVVVPPPPHAETASASTAPSVNAIDTYLTRFTDLPSGRRLVRAILSDASGGETCSSSHQHRSKTRR